MPPKRNICFVTGTRAEFGLMRSTLQAIRSTPSLQLQLIATGMHLSQAHGRTIDAIVHDGWKIDRTIPWKQTRIGPLSATTANAIQTGRAIASLAQAYEQLKSDLILVVGDRVEAFAAAAAAHIAGRFVAHVHGGDRALGQVDDSLRHAITKLSHLHFPATEESARRIRRLGEQAWRIHPVGSPGLDGIRQTAATPAQLKRIIPGLIPRRYALLALHPVDADQKKEYARACIVAGALEKGGIDQVIAVHPNNDPGHEGIMRCWRQRNAPPSFIVRADLPRPIFLGLMRDAAVLVGNSSSGIIEAATFATPVIDIGPRQTGRQRSRNVAHAPYDPARITRQIRRLVNIGQGRRLPAPNVYGTGNAGRRIAAILRRIILDDRLRSKLIDY